MDKRSLPHDINQGRHSLLRWLLVRSSAILLVARPPTLASETRHGLCWRTDVISHLPWTDNYLFLIKFNPGSQEIFLSFANIRENLNRTYETLDSHFSGSWQS